MIAKPRTLKYDINISTEKQNKDQQQRKKNQQTNNNNESCDMK